MRQFLPFAFSLTRQDPTLTVSQCRFTAPGGATQETWNVELTVTYLIYDPQKRD